MVKEVVEFPGKGVYTVNAFYRYFFISLLAFQIIILKKVVLSLRKQEIRNIDSF